MDNEMVTAISMYARWQGEMMRRIRADLYNAKRIKKLDRFTQTWTQIRCQWFVFDAGGSADTDTRWLVHGPLFPSF